MAPFGVHVTIVEPGGFRTDFAGASTEINDGHPDYAETVGKTAAMQRSYDGRQPGDPAKAAAAIIAVSRMDSPPLRLVLGRQAFARAEHSDERRLAELRAWRATSEGTDFTQDDAT
jgi:NAD(P)-dependent dehydrogenase (short-subunit alcohol dehydrogenase family)